MAGTRSSTRQAAAAANAGSISSQNPTEAKTGAAGSKRKGSTATGPKSKRGKKGDRKEQTTIEATMPTEGTEEPSKDVDMKDAMPSGQGKAETAEEHDTAEQASAKNTKATQEAAKTDDSIAKNTEDAKPRNGHGEDKDVKAQDDSEAKQDTDTSKMDNTGVVNPEDTVANGNGDGASKSYNAVEKSSEREKSAPSSILEKGIIYFFFRGRVGISEPSDVGDIARSYIVLRPLPHGAKLGDGPIGDAGNNRLLALPKKVLPVSPKDRFMVFVEKSSASIEEIKNNLASSDYMTKTAGSRHTPAAAPIGEGIYAITTTGRESHIAYILTIPAELSEVQHDIGLKERGSFVTSVKNPQYPGPANTNLPKGPEYPPEYEYFC